VATLMKEKHETNKKKAKELYEENFSVMKVSLSKEVETLVSKINEVKEEYDIGREEKRGAAVTMLEVNLKDRNMVKQNLYSSELNNQIMEGSIPHEISIYLLKTQLIDVCLANHNLQRYVSLTEWKLNQ
jgi:hypothetical protein